MSKVLPQVIEIHHYLIRFYRFALIKCNSLVHLTENFPAILNMLWFANVLVHLCVLG
jgi:hypothetical protein